MRMARRSCAHCDGCEPDLRFRGRGGPRMNSIAGLEFLDWIDEAGVVGLWEVVKHYGYFRAQFRAALKKRDPGRKTGCRHLD